MDWARQANAHGLRRLFHDREIGGTDRRRGPQVSVAQFSFDTAARSGLEYSKFMKLYRQSGMFSTTTSGTRVFTSTRDIHKGGGQTGTQS
jgi:hypothetical protein